MTQRQSVPTHWIWIAIAAGGGALLLIVGLLICIVFLLRDPGAGAQVVEQTPAEQVPPTNGQAKAKPKSRRAMGPVRLAPAVPRANLPPRPDWEQFAVDELFHVEFPGAPEVRERGLITEYRFTDQFKVEYCISVRATHLQRSPRKGSKSQRMEPKYQRMEHATKLLRGVLQQDLYETIKIRKQLRDDHASMDVIARDKPTGLIDCYRAAVWDTHSFVLWVNGRLLTDARKQEELHQDTQRFFDSFTPTPDALLAADVTSPREGSAEAVEPTPSIAKASSRGDAPAAAPSMKPPLTRAESLNRLKAATIYIQVHTSDGLQTGSGFLIGREGSQGSIVTNAHVIEPESGDLKSIKCVFHSGTVRGESTVVAETAGIDEARDLALLTVELQDLPEPLDIQSDVEPFETMPLLVLGFPFGEGLATGGRNPSITVSRGHVSSIRRDEYGRLAVVQVQSGINPGNSGGPVVTETGTLLGVSVAKVTGTEIGMAIPRWHLREMLQGRVGGVRMGLGAGGGPDHVVIVTSVQLVDPMHQLRDVSLSLIPQTFVQGTPRADKQGVWGPISDEMEAVPLKVEHQIAYGRFSLELGGESMYFFQVVCKRDDGTVFYSPPAQVDARTGRIPPSSDDSDQSLEAHGDSPNESERRKFRLWSDASGKFQIKAKLRSVGDGDVVLEREDGTEVTVPLNKLSDRDREYVDNLRR